MYQGLLWGEDPRNLIVGLRRRLHSRFQDQHDWASIVTYASLPPNFDDQLADACIQQAMDCINTALRRSDRVMQALSDYEGDKQPGRAPMTRDAGMKMLPGVRLQVALAKKRLESAIEAYPARKATILSKLASTEKREAQMEFHAMENWREDPKGMAHVFDKLDLARSYYWETYAMQRSRPWELAQYVSLTLLLPLCRSALPVPVTRPGQNIASLWTVAEVQSLNDAEHGTDKERAWAYGNLAELYLLALVIDEFRHSHTANDMRAQALNATVRTVALAGASSFHVFSTRRQILRYVDWFGPMAIDQRFVPVCTLAKVILEELPLCEEPEPED
jgi:hypothetical protein